MNLPNQTILFIAAAAVSAVCFYTSGYLSGKHSADAEMTELKQEYAVNAALAQSEYAAKLQIAEAERSKWHDFAQRQSVDLADALNRLDKQEYAIRREIQNAVETDKKSGNCIGGLGANSLKLYERALGYEEAKGK